MREHTSPAAGRPGAGRPTREQAEARQAELLDRALDMFLEKGFELATIEAIAASVGMTKRTIYASYADKSALFTASVQRAIERYNIPMDRLRAAESSDLETTLAAVAQIRMRNVMTPAGQKLQRILNTESYRFPEIFTMAYEQSTRPMIDYLADLLRRHDAAGTATIGDPEMAASAFMSLVLSGPVRSISAGGTFSAAELDKRIKFAVRLFINGVGPRPENGEKMTHSQNQPRTAVITGASSGIGLETAKALSGQGWRVIGIGRDPDRTRAAEAAIRAVETKAAPATMICADIAVLANVVRVAREIAALTPRIDILFNNAGGLTNAPTLTPEGNEVTFAANHLGHFLLTERLLPLLRAAAADLPPGAVRVVNTSSAAHISPPLDWNDLQLLDDFSMMGAYRQAKLANILFTRELGRRVAADGIVAHAMHPGLVDSNFANHGDDTLRAYLATRSDAMVSSELGAETLVWLATAAEPGTSTGGYYYQCAPAEIAPVGLDDDAALRLWEESEKLVAKAGV